MTTTHPTRRVAAYTRISRDAEGEALGVARQRHELEALAARLGVTVDRWFEDNDRGAGEGKHRPAFEELLAEAEAGRLDLVLAWSPDRMYRTLRDLVRVLDAFREVEVATVVTGGLDLGSADGRMVATMLGSVATRELERSTERLLAKHAELAREGRRAGGATPFGWRSAEEAEVVRRIVRGLLAGRSVASLRRELNSTGVAARAGSGPTRVCAPSRCAGPTAGSAPTGGPRSRPPGRPWSASTSRTASRPCCAPRSA